MYSLGIFGAGPNPSAAIVKNGRLLAVGEEERFTRIKNSPSSLPFRSIQFCLETIGISIDEVSRIGFAWDCPKYIIKQPIIQKRIRDEFKFDDNGFNENYEGMLLKNFDPQLITEKLRFGLAKSNILLKNKVIDFLDHHKCHAASSFYLSGFKDALIFTIDGSGEENCTVEWLGEDTSIKPLRFHTLPNTLGGYYGSFTEFLGFKSDSEEGKLMGLAPYGKFNEKIQEKLRKVLLFESESGIYHVDPRYRFFEKRTYNSKFSDLLVDLFGRPRFAGENFSQENFDLAFNVQWWLEKVVSEIINLRLKEYQTSNVCLAGGVAMNCKMNGVISKLPLVKNLFIQPAASDNGTAIGAALLLNNLKDSPQKRKMMHAYWGPKYSDEQILGALQESKLSFTRPKHLEEVVAAALNEGKIIGWFQGRSEIGARSLGNRSILANPLFPGMKDKLNLEVKHRESWRPFCPSFTSESFSRYFGHNKSSEFMITAYDIKNEYKDVLPSAVHVDGSVRPQSVDSRFNERFHRLLSEFGKLSGHPVLINTSFNIQGEPIVETPRDALRCYGGTGIDMLVLGNYVVEKI